ncbi:MAG: hypothetical protein MHPSP_000580 [Paramarteilia canceri]
MATSFFLKPLNNFQRFFSQKNVSNKGINQPDLRDFLRTSNYQQLDKPAYMKSPPPMGKKYFQLKNQLKKLNLSTVCQETKCPNIGECWGDNTSTTATIMIMGDLCTRACRFCSIKTARIPKPLDLDEPLKTALAIKEWSVDYIVITSVDRDDLPDFGASHFAETIKEIKLHKPTIKLEVLIPDFNGDLDFLAKIVDAKPDVIAHNIETVKSLQSQVRDRRASFASSIKILKNIKIFSPKTVSKTSIMLGLGESMEEVKSCMSTLVENDVDCLTLGQYIQPTVNNLKVKNYIKESEFKMLKDYGEKLGFKYVASGPLIRSSYRAGEFFIKNIIESRQ